MNALIAYYSRTGNTKKVADDLAQRLDADKEEIIDKKNRSGILGYIRGGREASKKDTADIGHVSYDPSLYDIVILGSPVWSSNMPPALRAYIRKFDFTGKKIALFCTMTQGGSDQMFSSISDETGSVPISTMALKARELKKGNYEEKLNCFIQHLYDL